MYNTHPIADQVLELEDAIIRLQEEVDSLKDELDSLDTLLSEVKMERNEAIADLIDLKAGANL